MVHEEKETINLDAPQRSMSASCTASRGWGTGPEIRCWLASHFHAAEGAFLLQACNAPQSIVRRAGFCHLSIHPSRVPNVRGPLLEEAALPCVPRIRFGCSAVPPAHRITYLAGPTRDHEGEWTIRSAPLAPRRSTGWCWLPWGVNTQHNFWQRWEDALARRPAIPPPHLPLPPSGHADSETV
jgi:hypothetical protein